MGVLLRQSFDQIVSWSYFLEHPQSLSFSQNMKNFTSKITDVLFYFLNNVLFVFGGMY